MLSLIDSGYALFKQSVLQGKYSDSIRRSMAQILFSESQPFWATHNLHSKTSYEVAMHSNTFTLAHLMSD